jgi:hypothetical protein
VQTSRELGRALYGARKVWKQLSREGIDIGRDQVAALMKGAGPQVIRRSKAFRTTGSGAADRFLVIAGDGHAGAVPDVRRRGRRRARCRRRSHRCPAPFSGSRRALRAHAPSLAPRCWPCCTFRSACDQGRSGGSRRPPQPGDRGGPTGAVLGEMRRARRGRHRSGCDRTLVPVDWRHDACRKEYRRVLPLAEPFDAGPVRQETGRAAATSWRGCGGRCGRARR